VRKSLQSVDHENVFVLGDCASVQDTLLPATAQVALQQAGTLANNLQIAWKNTLLGEAIHQQDQPKLQEFVYFSLGEMMSLGDFHGSISSLNGWVNLNGPLAAIGRRAVYAFRMPTLWQSVKAFTSAGHTTTQKILQDTVTAWSSPSHVSPQSKHNEETEKMKANVVQ